MLNDWGNIEHIMKLQLRILETLVNRQERISKQYLANRPDIQDHEVDYMKSCIQELNELLPDK